MALLPLVELFQFIVCPIENDGVTLTRASQSFADVIGVETKGSESLVHPTTPQSGFAVEVLHESACLITQGKSIYLVTELVVVVEVLVGSLLALPLVEVVAEVPVVRPVGLIIPVPVVEIEEVPVVRPVGLILPVPLVEVEDDNPVGLMRPVPEVDDDLELRTLVPDRLIEDVLDL